MPRRKPSADMIRASDDDHDPWMDPRVWVGIVLGVAILAAVIRAVL